MITAAPCCFMPVCFFFLSGWAHEAIQPRPTASMHFDCDLKSATWRAIYNNNSAVNCMKITSMNAGMWSASKGLCANSHPIRLYNVSILRKTNNLQPHFGSKNKDIVCHCAEDQIRWQHLNEQNGRASLSRRWCFGILFAVHSWRSFGEELQFCLPQNAIHHSVSFDMERITCGHLKFMHSKDIVSITAPVLETNIRYTGECTPRTRCSCFAIAVVHVLAIQTDVD